MRRGTADRISLNRRESGQTKTRVHKPQKMIFFSFIILLTTLLLAACDNSGQTAAVQKQPSPSDKKQPNLTQVRSVQVAKKAVSKLNSDPKAVIPYTDPVLAYKGETLYLQNCVFCHKAHAIGKPGVAPSLTNQEFLSIAPVNFLFDTIRDGRPGTGMPPFKHLGKEKINALVAYLRDHAKKPSRIKAVLAQPVNQGDARLGMIFFKQICATCHGPGGNGYAAGGTGTAIGKTGFLSKVSDGFIRTTIKEGRSFTRMLSFQGPQALADLSSKEIDDIIAYMRTVPGEKAQSSLKLK